MGVSSEVQVKVGGVAIGGGAPVVVQSMTLTPTRDVEATTAQIAALASAGCEVVRVAVPKNEDAAALAKLVYLSPLPVIADIHFNASLALKAIDAGVAAVRINPGNIGGPDRVEQVVTAGANGTTASFTAQIDTGATRASGGTALTNLAGYQVPKRIERVQTNLDTFVRRVVGAA